MTKYMRGSRLTGKYYPRRYKASKPLTLQVLESTPSRRRRTPTVPLSSFSVFLSPVCFVFYYNCKLFINRHLAPRACIFSLSPRSVKLEAHLTCTVSSMSSAEPDSEQVVKKCLVNKWIRSGNCPAIWLHEGINTSQLAMTWGETAGPVIFPR